MTGIENYFGFLAAGIILNITPGSDTIYILTRSISQGKKAGIVSALGISTGGLVHVLLASLGLSLILSQSALAFNIVRYLGASYLTYLGIKIMIQKSPDFENSIQVSGKSGLVKIYYQGILTNVFNPKVALFFLSFLPQFIHPAESGHVLPFFILGLTFFTTGTIWCIFLACLSSLMTKKLRENHKIAAYLQKISGTVFLLLALHLVLIRN